MIRSAADRALDYAPWLLGKYGAEHDRLLSALLGGASYGLERLTDVAYGTSSACPGERVLTDPLVCPFWALPHAAQWVGGTMPARPIGLTDAQWEAYARRAVVEPLGALRCSETALVTLASGYLSGSREVRVVQRVNNDPFVTALIISPELLADPAALTARVNADDVVLAGGRVDVITVTATTWAELSANSVTWNDLTSVSWQEISDGTYRP